MDQEYFSFLQATPFVKGINGALVGSQSPSEWSGRELASFLAVFIYGLTQGYNELWSLSAITLSQSLLSPPPNTEKGSLFFPISFLK